MQNFCVTTFGGYKFQRNKEYVSQIGKERTCISAARKKHPQDGERARHLAYGHMLGDVIVNEERRHGRRRGRNADPARVGLPADASRVAQGARHAVEIRAAAHQLANNVRLGELRAALGVPPSAADAVDGRAHAARRDEGFDACLAAVEAWKTRGDASSGWWARGGE